MLTQQKSIIENLLSPVASLFKSVNPNVLTLLGSIPSLLFFVFVLNHWYFVALLALLGNFFDLIDGMVARKYNKVTAFGGFLDSTFDRISDFFIITAFGFAGIVRWEIVTPLLLFSFLTSYIRSRGELAKSGVSFAVGLIERTERLIIITIALLLYMFLPTLSFSGFNVAEVTLVLLILLSLYTVFQRIIHAYKNL
jgi:archaetidylinositol phosphate synthase